jgi:hypothetical protein
VVLLSDVAQVPTCELSFFDNPNNISV